MPPPLYVYFHYESSLKIVRIPDFGAAIQVTGLNPHDVACEMTDLSREDLEKLLEPVHLTQGGINE
jgi:hypothetical protein